MSAIYRSALYQSQTLAERPLGWPLTSTRVFAEGPCSRISTGLAQLPARSEGKGWGRAATPDHEHLGAEIKVRTEAGLRTLGMEIKFYTVI